MMPQAFLAAALVLSFGWSAAAAEVVVTRLDGSTVSGEFRSWSSRDITVETKDGTQSVALEQLLFVRWSPETAPPSGVRPAAVELIDGTRIPIEDVSISGGRATATRATTATDTGNASVSLPVQRIAAVRLRALPPAVAEQWEEIRSQNLPSDVLVVARRGGESLDYVECVVGDVTSDKIDLKLDGEATKADRSAAAGIIYLRKETANTPQPLCILSGRSGLRANVAEATIAPDAIRLKTVAGVEFEWPLGDIYLADFSAGKVVYLSDLEPAAERWTPLVALPAASPSAAAFGKVRRDRSPFDRPLALWIPDDAAPDGRGYERSLAKGLAIRSRVELAYRLPAGFQRFAALAGIDPKTSEHGNVTLTISGDDRALLETEIAGDQPPRPIDLEITGVRRLSIVVDYGRNLDTGDWLILGDARILK